MKYLQERNATANKSVEIFAADTGLEEIAVMAGVSRAPKLGLADPIPCPCCKQPVRVPTVDIVASHYKLTPLETRILGAIWRGKGMPVQTERVFDAMYADDPDGGPPPGRMYSAFKVALCHMRAKLEGSGVSIETVGYRRGFRLVLGE